MRRIVIFLALLYSTALFANSAPVLSNVRALQRSGTYLVDIYYNLYDADSDLCHVNLQVSDDGGATWNVSCNLCTGAIGSGQSSGNNKHIVWDAGAEHPNQVKDYHFKVIAYDSSSSIPDMVFVSGGTFNNGTSNVTLSSFYISKYETTQAEYQAVMGSNPASGYGVGANYPVYYVSWFKAIEYCNRRSMQEGLTPCYSYSTYGTNPSSWPSGWNTSSGNHTNVSCNWTANGYRLPTEMEWMYAAKGGNQSQGYSYSGSNDINAVAWYYSNSGGTTHTVGTKLPNELGIYDMSGNVWEWCWDIYGSYPSGAQTDPHGAASGSYRVLRGGSWSVSASDCTVSYRHHSNATSSLSGLGFRVCRVFP